MTEISRSKNQSADELHVCIYCSRTLGREHFNREHVLSDAFGRYTNALVLHTCVCRDCNTYFANNLEVLFARDSFEALLRCQTGLSHINKERFEPKFVELRLASEGAWDGVRLKLVPGEKGGMVEIIPQAAFYDARPKRWIHFTIADINRGDIDGREGLRTSPIRIFSQSIKERDDVIAALKLNGISFKEEGDLPPPTDILESTDVLVDFTYTVNLTMRRCVAKYAFNYLAYRCGVELALLSDFDTIRRFIRFGEVPGFPLVKEEFRAILQHDSPTTRQTNGHLITVNWTATGVDVVAQVSLFNYLVYSISLARNFTGIWRPIRSGSHFDVEKRRVEDLTSFSAALLP